VKVPLVDLSLQHREVAEEVERGLAEVMAKTAFVMGPQVAAFEGEFAAFCGVRHCVGVANGTDALELMLRAVGVGPGDEVIVPAHTFIATAAAVTFALGALCTASILRTASVVDRAVKVAPVIGRLPYRTGRRTPSCSGCRKVWKSLARRCSSSRERWFASSTDPSTISTGL